MDERERFSRVEELRQETIATLEDRVVALEKLIADYPTIDIDVLTDIHPEILDGRSEVGKEQLDFWNNFYSNLEDSPSATATIRYRDASESHRPIAGYSRVPLTILRAVWVRVYENLSAADVLFVKGVDPGEGSKVVIASPSVLIGHNKDLEYVHEPTVLFDTQSPNVSVFEQEPHEFACRDIPHVIHAMHPENRLFHIEDVQKYINTHSSGSNPFFITHDTNYKTWCEQVVQQVRSAHQLQE